MRSFWDYLVGIGITIFGRLASILSKKDVKALRPFNLVCELIIASFIGAMVMYLLDWKGIVGPLSGLICGGAGWAGASLIELALRQYAKLKGVNIPEDKKQDDERENKL